ncbi:hypothetical protein ACP70R_015042 [Stipagrostis hirtigluma subsp. patula]
MQPSFRCMPNLARRRSPPAPAAASPPPPLPPCPPPLPPCPPPLHQQPLPAALLPPKKRPFPIVLIPREVASPSPSPPHPPAAAAADDLALPTRRSPHPGLPQRHDAGPSKRLTPAPAAAAVEVPSTASPPAASEKPYAPPPPAADEKSAHPPASDAAARPEPAWKVGKIVRRRRSVRKTVPKGTTAASSAAGASQTPERRAPGQSSSYRNAAADESRSKEKIAREPVVQNPAAACHAVPAPGKPAAACDAVPAPEMVEEGALAKEPAADCDAMEVEKLENKAMEMEDTGMSESERRRRMATEVFVSGLSRAAKEEDVRAALAKAGEITDVHMIMDGDTKRNKGYCFVRYSEPAQAKKAIAEFGNVKAMQERQMLTEVYLSTVFSNICGKHCQVAAVDGNHTIFLGNLDKKWKEQAIMELLCKIGVENIDDFTLMADYNNPGLNRGFAFLVLNTNRDAQIAFKMLSKKDAFGKGQNVTVAWAKSTYRDENEIQKVKSIFVEGIPNTWDQEKMMEIFRKYGKIERVVLSRDMLEFTRRDFGFIHYATHEAAMLCVESFDNEELTSGGSKIKVSLAKPGRKGKKNSKEDHTKTKVSRAPYPNQAYPHKCSRDKRPFSALGCDSSCRKVCNSRPRHESSTYVPSTRLSQLPSHHHMLYWSSAYVPATASYGAPPHVTAGYYPPYHYGNRRGQLGSYYGHIEPSSSGQWRMLVLAKQGIHMEADIKVKDGYLATQILERTSF